MIILGVIFIFLVILMNFKLSKYDTQVEIIILMYYNSFQYMATCFKCHTGKDQMMEFQNLKESQWADYNERCEQCCTDSTALSCPNQVYFREILDVTEILSVANKLSLKILLPFNQQNDTAAHTFTNCEINLCGKITVALHRNFSFSSLFEKIWR